VEAVPTVAAQGQRFVLTLADASVTEWVVRMQPAPEMDPAADAVPAFAAGEPIAERYPIEGGAMTLPLVMPDAERVILVAEGLRPGEEPVRRVWEIRLGTPRDALLSAWMAIVAQDDGTYRRANTASAPGQCKRYLITQFAAISKGFCLTTYPRAALFMPPEHNDRAKAQDNRAEGAGWTLPVAEMGNPFYEAARFDIDVNGSQRANREAALALIRQARPGDVLQMMAVYNNGVRGTHTMLITSYDPATDTLHWSDSNFRMKSVGGVRYGQVVAGQSRQAEEIARWLAQPSCGATLYRVRWDIGLRAAEGGG
jgi:hypothetical protein